MTFQKYIQSIVHKLQSGTHEEYEEKNRYQPNPLSVETGEALMESITEGIVTVDTGGVITAANKTALALLKSKKCDVVDKHIATVFLVRTESGPLSDPETRPYDCVMAHLDTCKTNPRKTYFCLRSDGSEFPVVYSAGPYKTGDVLRGVVIVFHDVTEEKYIDNMKTECIALASHQLRTPLTAISWYTELIQSECATMPNELREHVEQIADSSNRMIKLVNSLLNVYRIERGEISIDPQNTDIVSIILETAEELSSQFLEKNITLSKDLPPSLPAKADKQLVQIVIENLLTNAAKYVGVDGNISLSLSHTTRECQITIRDNGCGIPKNQMHKIFEKFFRADNVLTNRTRGVGIGLYIVHAIVKAWGGHIWCESEEGKGTAFHFTMPLAMRKLDKGHALS